MRGRGKKRPGDEACCGLARPTSVLRVILLKFTQPSSHSVALKHGVDLSELTSGDGAEIEIDTDAEQTAAAGARAMREEEGRSLDEQYDRNEIYKQVSLEPILGSRDEGSESESDDGAVWGLKFLKQVFSKKIVLLCCGQTPFENLARKMTDLTGDGGVLKEILRQGEGIIILGIIFCTIIM